MGKRGRGSAKTGDKAMYKSRMNATSESTPKDSDDNDQMYGIVDRFHNQRDEEFLKLEQDVEDSEDEEQEEAIMDLGVGGDSSDADSDSDEDNADQAPVDRGEDSSSEEEVISSDEDNDDEDEEDVRHWGKRKSAYYNGDTADLEIGQEEEDAFVEAEAAKSVQAARFKDMSEDDFMLSDDDNDKNQLALTDVAGLRDVSKLSSREKIKLIEKQHPEMLPLVSHFGQIFQNWENNTQVATEAVLNGEKGTAQAVGATKAGQQYLLTKDLIQTSSTLNLVMYLLLKGEMSKEEDLDPSSIQNHPVMSRLQKLDSTAIKLQERVEDKVDGLQLQLENLVKAAELMASGVGADESESEEEEDEPVPAAEATDDDSSDSDEKEAESSGPQVEDSYRDRVNNARFSVRTDEMQSVPSKKRRRRAVDFGDAQFDTDPASTAALATTLNAIEQRTAAKASKKKGDAEGMDDLDAERLRRGIAMMEEDLGPMSDEDMEPGGGDEGSIDNSDEDNAFYDLIQKKSKAKKDARKSMYEVAPKFPTPEDIVEGERAVSKQILKNRGLVAHKPKLNRNPRVKKREQYRKALIRRKGVVREVRTDEGHKYGGEETGIKTQVTKSRKLN